MGRSPCCSKEGMNRGAWTAHEDKTLIDYIKAHGEGRWRNLPKKAGLKRCGKSCRLRWLNYLRPDIKRGNISKDEEELIIRLHKLLGNRWSLIAGRLPGRTDNEIKNYWNTNLGKKVQNHHHQASVSGSRYKQQNKANNRGHLSPNKAAMSSPLQKESSVHVVRTKAIKCTKVVFIKPQPQPQTTIERASISSSMENQITPESNSSNYGLSSFDSEEINPLMDFNMGEFCFSDLLDFNFSDFKIDLGGDDFSSSTGQPILFSEEMLQDWTAGNGIQTNVASN